MSPDIVSDNNVARNKSCCKVVLQAACVSAPRGRFEQDQQSPDCAVSPGTVIRAWRDYVRGVRVLAHVQSMLKRERAKAQQQAAAAAQQRAALLSCLAACAGRWRGRSSLHIAWGRCELQKLSSMSPVQRMLSCIALQT
jgi:hypothetical protein